MFPNLPNNHHMSKILQEALSVGTNLHMQVMELFKLLRFIGRMSFPNPIYRDRYHASMPNSKVGKNFKSMVQLPNIFN